MAKCTETIMLITKLTLSGMGRITSVLGKLCLTTQLVSLQLILGS